MTSQVLLPGVNHPWGGMSHSEFQPPGDRPIGVRAFWNRVFFSIQALKKIELFPGKPPEQTFESSVFRSKTISRTKLRVDSVFHSQNICTSKYEHHRLTSQPIIAILESWDDCKAKTFVLGNRKRFPLFLWFFCVFSIAKSWLWPKNCRRKVLNFLKIEFSCAKQPKPAFSCETFRRSKKNLPPIVKLHLTESTDHSVHN